MKIKCIICKISNCSLLEILHIFKSRFSQLIVKFDWWSYLQRATFKIHISSSYLFINTQQKLCSDSLLQLPVQEIHGCRLSTVAQACPSSGCWMNQHFKYTEQERVAHQTANSYLQNLATDFPPLLNTHVGLQTCSTHAIYSTAFQLQSTD